MRKTKGSILKGISMGYQTGSTRRAFLQRSGLAAAGLALSSSFLLVAQNAPTEIRVGANESIQRAVERVADGGTVRVAPGVYRETVIIEKPLTVLSEAGPRATIVKADPDRFEFDDGPIDDIVVGAFNVYQTQDVALDGFTVTEALEGVWATVCRRVDVRNMISFGNDSSGYYFWSCQNAELTDSWGYDNAVGLYQGQSGEVNVERSLFMFNRSGTAPHLGGLEFPGVGILVGNLSNTGHITGCHCVNNRDAGIRVNFRISNIEVEGNEVRHNRAGIVIGETQNTVHRNNIVDNAEFGLDTALEIDARNNWWGDPSGPSGAGPGQGDVVTSSAQFDPWLPEPADVSAIEV